MFERNIKKIYSFISIYKSRVGELLKIILSHGFVVVIIIWNFIKVSAATYNTKNILSAFFKKFTLTNTFYNHQYILHNSSIILLQNNLTKIPEMHLI